MHEIGIHYESKSGWPMGLTHLVARPSDDGWEDGPWGVVSGETGLAHTGAVVDYQSCYVVVAHDDCCVCLLDSQKRPTEKERYIYIHNRVRQY